MILSVIIVTNMMFVFTVVDLKFVVVVIVVLVVRFVVKSKISGLDDLRSEALAPIAFPEVLSIQIQAF